MSEETESGRLHIVLDHIPDKNNDSTLRLDIEIWSYNSPILMVRCKTTNLSNALIRDLKLYNIMDFDIGGPTSYKDDVGKYDSETATMLAWDDTPLCVAITSKPIPDAWEIGSPIKLMIDVDDRDLTGHITTQPADIATALQWNLGDYNPMDTKCVDIVITAAQHLDEAKALVYKAWEQFDKRIR